MHKPKRSNFLESLRKWRTRFSPLIGAGVACLFIFWVWVFRDRIRSSFEMLGGTEWFFLIILILLSVILTVYALVILVRAKGYNFSFADGYYVLNLSQLASMVPGGIWGIAGFAGILLSKGISKVDSAIIIFLNTIVMLTACGIVGILGLVSILGWVYVMICFLPFLFILFGRDQLDILRQKYYPESSCLPSSITLLKTLFLGVVIWVIVASCFTWFLYTNEGINVVPFWTVVGAYTTGYLGGYLAFLVPSGLGVSEGLTTLILAPYMATDRILANAVSFRIIHTLIIWCNILLSVALNSRRKRINIP